MDVDAPFPGRVHCFAADYATHELVQWERDALIAWSSENPDTPLIYIAVECFGGVCEEQGFVLEAGKARGALNWADGHLAALFRLAGNHLKTRNLAFLHRNIFQFDDDAYMRRALALARTHHGKTGKNPSVGCVIVTPSGETYEAVTAKGGTPHAEEHIVSQFGPLLKDATAYVTLEPCRERTSGGESCSTLLAKSGIVRCVSAIADAHPKGAGGHDVLDAAGIAVETGLRREEAEAMYADFFKQT